MIRPLEKIEGVGMHTVIRLLPINSTRVTITSTLNYRKKNTAGLPAILEIVNQHRLGEKKTKKYFN